ASRIISTLASQNRIHSQSGTPRWRCSVMNGAQEQVTLESDKVSKGLLSVVICRPNPGEHRKHDEGQGYGKLCGKTVKQRPGMASRPVAWSKELMEGPVDPKEYD